MISCVPSRDGWRNGIKGHIVDKEKLFGLNNVFFNPNIVSNFRSPAMTITPVSRPFRVLAVLETLYIFFPLYTNTQHLLTQLVQI